jgi:cytochrome c
MKLVSARRPALAGIFFACATLVAGGAMAADEEAAKALARQNNCFKCHGVDKKKDGPAWREVAAKYKGKADAEQKLTNHLTSAEKVKFPDGHEEDHKVIKGEPADVKNLVDFILSL